MDPLLLPRELHLVHVTTTKARQHSAERPTWGPCKAIEDTFRRISLEAPEGVNIRFYQVNATQVLSSLKNPPPEAGRHQRPKNTDAIKDTLPEAWTDTLEQQEARAKPLFVFFKEGRRVDRIDGCNTPLIRATAKDLCTVKIPANQVITNSRMLEFWEDKFPPDESEVAFDKFCKGLQEFLELPNVAFQDAEERADGGGGREEGGAHGDRRRAAALDR